MTTASAGRSSDLLETPDEATQNAGVMANTIAAALPLALGIAGAVAAFGLKVGTPAEPGPGFWPLVASLLLVFTSALLAFTKTPPGETEALGRSSLLVLVGAISLVIFVAAIPLIGFEFPCLSLMLLWTKALHGETWKASIITSVSVVIVAYALFVFVLRIPLPHLF